MPDQQPLARDVAVVVAGATCPVFEPEALVCRQGDDEYVAPSPDVGQGDPLPRLSGQTRLRPSQKIATPGRQARRAVVALPTKGTPAHEPPGADARRIAGRGPRFRGAQKGRVEQVGQAQMVAELVARGAHGFGEVAASLHGALHRGDNDDAGLPNVVCLVVGEDAEIGDAGGPAHDEVGRSLRQNHEQVVDDTVVVSGIRYAVGAVVVEASEVDIDVHQGEDFGDQVTVAPRLVAGVAEVGRRRLAGRVVPGRHLAAHSQTRLGHGVVEMAERTRRVRVEEAGGPGRWPCGLPGIGELGTAGASVSNSNKNIEGHLQLDAVQFLPAQDQAKMWIFTTPRDTATLNLVSGGKNPSTFGRRSIPVRGVALALCIPPIRVQPGQGRASARE